MVPVAEMRQHFSMKDRMPLAKTSFVCNFLLDSVLLCSTNRGPGFLQLLLPRMGSGTICFLAGSGEPESAKFSLISAILLSAVGVVVDVKLDDVLRNRLKCALRGKMHGLL